MPTVLEPAEPNTASGIWNTPSVSALSSSSSFPAHNSKEYHKTLHTWSTPHTPVHCNHFPNKPVHSTTWPVGVTGTNFLWPDALKKVKVAHTRLPSVGFRSWSQFLAVSLQVAWIINPTVGCHYFLPGLQLPPQPLRGLLPILLLGEQRHDGCEQFAYNCYLTASQLQFEPGPFCAWVNTKPKFIYLLSTIHDKAPRGLITVG